MLKASPKNQLVGSKAYAKILHEYNERLSKDGKVNNKKFFEEVIVKELPGYHLQSWYQFLKRYKTEAGIIAAEISNQSPATLDNSVNTSLTATLLKNQDATAKGIQMALNIGADRLTQIMENPQLMSAKEAIDLLFKAMKAQDSRIHAVGKIREDVREQEKFERTFSESAYGDQ